MFTVTVRLPLKPDSGVNTSFPSTALADAMSLVPLMRHPPEARHVALPLPLGRMSEVSDDEAPLRNVLVTTTAFGAVVVVVVVAGAVVAGAVAAIAPAWPTASTGAE